MSFFNTFGVRQALLDFIACPSYFDNGSRAPRAPKRSPTPDIRNLSSRWFTCQCTHSPISHYDESKATVSMQPISRAALVKGNFKTIVMLPKYVDVMEWVAVNSTFPKLSDRKLVVQSECAVFDFYNNLNFFYGINRPSAALLIHVRQCLRDHREQSQCSFVILNPDAL